MSNINIIQWNCRSVYSNLSDLKKLLTDKNVDIAALSETWLNLNNKLNISGYNIIRKDRVEKGGGGVAIIVKKHIPYNLINIKKNFNKLESVAIKISLNGKITTIISLYCAPGHKITSENWLEIIEEIETEQFIMLGDFNCHHQVWGSNYNDNQGIDLITALDTKNLIILNNGTNTMQPNPYRNMQPVDLTIISSQLYTCSEWNVLSNDSAGSDHYPILTTIITNQSMSQHRVAKNYRSKRIKWEIYREKVNKIFADSEELKIKKCKDK